MTFDRYPNYANELIEINYNTSFELKKIKKGISLFNDENSHYYDYDVDTENKSVLITVDEYSDYKRLKYLILTAKIY